MRPVQVIPGISSLRCRMRLLNLQTAMAHSCHRSSPLRSSALAMKGETRAKTIRIKRKKGDFERKYSCNNPALKFSVPSFAMVARLLSGCTMTTDGGLIHMLTKNDYKKIVMLASGLVLGYAPCIYAEAAPVKSEMTQTSDAANESLRQPQGEEMGSGESAKQPEARETSYFDVFEYQVEGNTLLPKGQVEQAVYP